MFDKETQLEILIDKGFDAVSITKIINKDGGSQNLKALQSLLTQGADGKTQLEILTDKGFDVASITKIIGHGGGSQNLKALQSILTQGADRKTQLEILTDKGFDAASIIKIIGNNGGSQNLEALQSLLTQGADGKTQLEILKDEGFDIASIIKIIGHGGGSQNLKALQSLLTQGTDGKTQLEILIDKGFDAVSITKIIGHGGGSKTLAALQSILAAFNKISGFTLDAEHIKLLIRLSTASSKPTCIAFIEQHIQNNESRDYLLSDIQHFSALVSYSAKQKASQLKALLPIEALQLISKAYIENHSKVSPSNTYKRKANAMFSSLHKEKKVKSEKECKRLHPISLNVIRETIKRLRTTKTGAVSQALQNCATVLNDLRTGLAYYRETGQILNKQSSTAPSMPMHAPVKVQDGQTIALTSHGQHLYGEAGFISNQINENDSGECVEEIRQVDQVTKEIMSVEQLKRLHTGDKSGMTSLHEISYWHDESKSIGHVFGAISRQSEVYFFEPQITNTKASPFVDIDCYSKLELHTMILDTWYQDALLENESLEHRGKRIKKEGCLHVYKPS